jgi:ribosomal-protein-alanine N-acetyltransferase
MELQSTRLVFSKFAKQHLADYLKLVTDKDLMRFIHNGAMSELDAKARFEVIVEDNKKSPQFGFWACRSISNDELIGFVKIAAFEADKIELGYAVIPKYWGKGYASEMLQTMMDFSIEHFGQKPLVGVVQEQNIASRKMLEKFGFGLARSEKMENYTLLYFERIV